MSVHDEYLSKLEPSQRKELERVKSIIASELPEAVEVMSYEMPGYKYKGKYFIGFAGFKDHMSIFPTAFPIEVLGDKLRNYKLSKGTIQFTIDNPIPDELVREIIEIKKESIDTQ